MPSLILASSSPRRRELLAGSGIPFTVIKPDIDETQRPGEAPLDYVRRMSREKAQAVASEAIHPLLDKHVGTRRALSEGVGNQIIFAADTVVILGADTLGIDEHGEILGKPKDAADARAMLRRLRGRTHQVCTALTLHMVNSAPEYPARPDFSPSPCMGRGPGGGVNIFTRLTTTNVTMRDYSDAEIDAYLATGDPFDKAGSYAIQHPTFKPVARIDGCYTNVVGLPVCTLKTMLAEIDWPGMEKVVGCDCDETMLPT